MPTRSPWRSAFVAPLALCLFSYACTATQDLPGDDASPPAPVQDSSATPTDSGSGAQDGAATERDGAVMGDAGRDDMDPDPVFEPPPPPRREPLGCSGSALACNLRSTASCAVGSGCQLDGDCSGLASSCSYQRYSSTCNDVSGCYWSSLSDACRGSAHSCGSFSTFGSCIDQPGCRWSDDCVGNAAACESLSGLACDDQPGCAASCSGGLSPCGGQCVDTADDELNCGACGFACGPRSNCSRGQCECTAPAILCEGRCVDPRTDAENCDVCGNACGAGFTCEDRSCVDQNECASNPCLDGRPCNNVPGSYVCGACPDGYREMGRTRCQEVDECAVDNGGCDPNAECVNEPGSFHCGACKLGYSGTNATGCKDINECASNHGGCDALSTCSNLPGSYVCGDCPSGYFGSGASGCIDIDECQQNHGSCDPITSCTNLPGTRECGACPSGYTGTGELGCQDIDECAVEHGGCDAKAACINELGSYYCGPCPTGYSGTGATSCEDIDECANDHGGCDPLVTCTNEPGTRSCGACPAGYSGTGFTDCIPYLTQLSTSVGTLSPSFDSATLSYTLTTPLLAGSMNLTAVAPAGAVVKIDGQVTTSGVPSAGIPLTISAAGQPIVVEVGREGRGSRTYRFTVSRGAAMRSPLSVPGPIDRFSLDGDTLVTGYADTTNQVGVAKIYTIANGTVGLVTSIPAPEAVRVSGYTVALSGNRLAVKGNERVYIYERANQTWGLAATIPAPVLGMSFGGNLTLDGDTLVTNANGFVVFHKDSAGWQLENAALPQCFQAKAVAGHILVGCNDRVEIWDRSPNGIWSMSQSITQDPSARPYVVGDAATDGDTLVILDRTSVSPDPTSYDVVVYERSGLDFVFRARTRRTFGSPEVMSYSPRAAAGGGMIALGQITDTTSGTGLNPLGTAGGTRTGAVHLFTRESGWSEPAWLKAPTASSAVFGGSLVMTSKYMAVMSTGTTVGAYIYPYTN